MRTTKKIEKSYSEEVSSIVCDNCKREMTSISIHSLPVGSFMVIEIPENPAVISPNDKEFCSESCLQEYYWHIQDLARYQETH